MRHAISRRALLGAFCALPLLAGGCGFRLRGHFQAPFDTLFLQMQENTRFSGLLKRMIESGSNIRVVRTPQEADAILELLDTERDREVLSINDEGLAREYELRYTIEFRVSSPDGFDFVEPTKIELTRDLTYSESEFLSRDTEEGILYRDMENDAISQIVRYIEASRNPEESDRVERGAQ